MIAQGCSSESHRLSSLEAEVRWLACEYTMVAEAVMDIEGRPESLAVLLQRQAKLIQQFRVLWDNGQHHLTGELKLALSEVECAVKNEQARLRHQAKEAVCGTC